MISAALFLPLEQPHFLNLLLLLKLAEPAQGLSPLKYTPAESKAQMRYMMPCFNVRVC
jgi:hypothetical protein